MLLSPIGGFFVATINTIVAKKYTRFYNMYKKFKKMYISKLIVYKRNKK